MGILGNLIIIIIPTHICKHIRFVVIAIVISIISRHRFNVKNTLVRWLIIVSAQQFCGPTTLAG